MSKMEDVWARMERKAEAFEAEQARIDQVRSSGYVPPDVGPEIVEAPARGAVRMFEPKALYPKGQDDFELKSAGFQGRKALQRADAFDVMAATAKRQQKAAPFTVSQVTMGRVYRGLVERYLAAGVKCSSLEGLSQSGGSSGGEFMDAVLRDRDQLVSLRDRIGSGVALSSRRRGVSGDRRELITDRDLVDLVCVSDLRLVEVLKKRGWSDWKGNVDSLTQSLGAALDRMTGPVGARGIKVMRGE